MTPLAVGLPGYIDFVAGIFPQVSLERTALGFGIAADVSVQCRQSAGLHSHRAAGAVVAFPDADGNQPQHDAVEDGDRAEIVADRFVVRDAGMQPTYPSARSQQTPTPTNTQNRTNRMPTSQSGKLTNHSMELPRSCIVRSVTSDLYQTLLAASLNLGGESRIKTADGKRTRARGKPTKPAQTPLEFNVVAKDLVVPHVGYGGEVASVPAKLRRMRRNACAGKKSAL